MLKALIDFLLNRKGHPTQHDTPTLADAPVAPYKIETPEPAKCGCGRSPTGYCVGLHKRSDAEWAVHPDNKKPAAEVKSDGGIWPFPTPAEKPMKPAVKAKSARAKKAPAAAMTAAEKPKKAPAKPRKPRAPKA